METKKHGSFLMGSWPENQDKATVRFTLLQHDVREIAKKAVFLFEEADLKGYALQLMHTTIIQNALMSHNQISCSIRCILKCAFVH